MANNRAPLTQEERAEQESKRQRQEDLANARIEREISRQLKSDTLTAAPRGLHARAGITTLPDALAHLERFYTAEMVQLHDDLVAEGLEDEVPEQQVHMRRFWRGLKHSLLHLRYTPPLTPEELGSLAETCERYILKAVERRFEAAVEQLRPYQEWSREYLAQWAAYNLKHRLRATRPNDTARALLYGSEAEAREALGWGPEYAEIVEVSPGQWELRHAAPRRD